MKLLLALAAVVSLGAPAIAQPVSIVVGTADLNLASATGQTRLDRRIARAAEAACGAASTIDLVGQKRVRDCRVAAVASAAPQRDAVLALAPVAVASAAR
ncbi:UrcA family protein [Glacieibacterium frigidum]|uniref:UrcA family protein n=1 Tax=Glacieibacterium frigidum TaxID=2593303 RepID=A0A552UJ26_9SPHN|nr:UrcA family protein [Glacieibacterium frigidum]TRW18184.1 UrcA family protein [Glacieibacterium frigidum]